MRRPSPLCLVLLPPFLATLPGCGEPCPEAPGLAEDACAQVRELRLPEALPPARGNAYADNPDAALLGFRIFFDARFSSNQEVRCATCHMPERKFQDGRDTAKGLARVTRNSPTLLNAAWLGWQAWDGHADSLWAQPLSALENPAEMDFTRLELAHRIRTSYRAPYESVFGPLPALEDTARFPTRGAPGSSAFVGMAPEDQQAIHRVAANVGKALEAYQRKLAAGPSALDRHLAGEADALAPEAVRGLAVFVRAGCTGCHGGPLLTDEGFHNLGVPALPGDALDAGRQQGLARVTADPLNALGAFHDGPPEDDAGRYRASPSDLGAFRTPSLRNVGFSAPYGHNGVFATLEEVVDFHLQGGGRGGTGFLGEVDPALKVIALTPDERGALLAFLRSLDGRYPEPPWNNWPEK
jgi:cytochrome c peroxidase